jgi:signal transduction histidine kinase
VTGSTRARLAWAIATGSAVLVVLFVVYDLTLGNGWNDAILAATVVLAVGAFGVVGATIASRTGNAVGWALLAFIGIFAVAGSTESYATYSLLNAAQPLPLTSFFAWVGTIMFFVTLASIVSIPLLYPTGTPQWRWVWRLYLASVAVLTVGFAILPQELSLMANDVPGPSNPYAIEAWGTPVGVILGIAGSVILLCAALSIVSLILRFRRSHGDERQQIRWLAYVGIAAGVAFVLVFVISAIYGDTPTSDVGTVLENAAFMLLLWIVLFGIPAACGVAVMKYRLYDLDIVIRKAVIFTLVTVTLIAVYLGVLALATVGNAPRLLVGILLLIVTFRPVHQAARAIADRLVYGKRASAHEVMTEFTGHVAETYATEDVLPRMARILAEGTGAATARVFLRLGTDQRPVATWPPNAEPTDEEIRVPVLDQGEELGALGVTMPPNDPWDTSRERLVNDLASQAGLVLRNVRLIEELKASRQRLVAAQDEERRKLERNIHDGAQQQLVALNVQLGLLARTARSDPAAAERMAGTLQASATEALEDLRDLARGIYPPLLADKGLVAALEAQARKAAVPTTVESDGIGRFGQDVEAAVDFSCLEALQNVAKYADASRATIALSNGDGSLSFTVTDDGTGFDSSATSYGTGLQGIADRLASLGGEVSVVSAPGEGTTITGTVPA